jgi:hypothetical protein
VQIVVRRALAAGTSPIDAVNDWLTSWCEYAHPDSHDLAERYNHFNEGPRPRPSLWRRAANDPTFQACNAFDRAAADNVVKAALFPKSYKASVARMLYEDPEHTLWPGMKIQYVYCANSLWSCIYGADTVRERFEAAVPGRKMMRMAQADHFVSVFLTGRVFVGRRGRRFTGKTPIGSWSSSNVFRHFVWREVMKQLVGHFPLGPCVC